MTAKRDPLAKAAEEYSKLHGTYRDFAACVRDLVNHIVASHRIAVHSVTCRAKEPESLSRKLQRTGKTYRALDDVTDLAGVRVITYFTDDAEKIADLIEAEFKVDHDNSVDKRRLLEPHEFGYISIHHVACLSDPRLKLPEYSKFRGLKVEIQTRSILQHAWAEIEHDLGYKSTTQVPKQLRRRISRLAGLLELADQEFQAVRTGIEKYERNLPQLVRESPTSVDLDKSSVEAYVRHSKVLHATDQRIANALNTTVSARAYVDYAVSRLAWLGVTHLGNLDELLKQNRDSIIRFAEAFMSKREEGQEDRGIMQGTSLFYLAYVLAGQRSNEALERFVREAMAMQDKSEAKQFADHLRQTWERVVHGKRPQLTTRQAHKTQSAVAGRPGDDGS